MGLLGEWEEEDAEMWGTAEVVVRGLVFGDWGHSCGLGCVEEMKVLGAGG